MGRSKQTSEREVAMAAGGAALVASILGNLKQYGENEKLQHSIEALQRLVQDWQSAYHNLDAQLALALRANEEHAKLIGSLREELDRVKTRTYAAEQRALEAEAALDRARPSKDAR
jgi:predicted  nucleic acid-binding Zn-ribbon protein